MLEHSSNIFLIPLFAQSSFLLQPQQNLITFFLFLSSPHTLSTVFQLLWSPSAFCRVLHHHMLNCFSPSILLPPLHWLKPKETRGQRSPLKHSTWGTEQGGEEWRANLQKQMEELDEAARHGTWSTRSVCINRLLHISSYLFWTQHELHDVDK